MAGAAEGVDGEAEGGLEARAGENAIGAGAGMGDHKPKEETQGTEPVSDGEGARHPLVG